MRDAENGFTFAADDLDDLTRALRRAWEDREVRRRAWRDNPVLARERGDEVKNSDRMLALVEEAVAAARPRPAAVSAPSR